MQRRYNEDYNGVVLSYSKVVIFGRKAPILSGLNPYLHVRLSTQLLLFAPQPGSVLGERQGERGKGMGGEGSGEREGGRDC